MYRKLHRTLWLPATSLKYEPGIERRVKQLYAPRMQIEETLHDNKSHRHGFGLRYARTRSANRLQVPLLLAARATLVFWLSPAAVTPGLLGQELRR